VGGGQCIGNSRIFTAAVAAGTAAAVGAAFILLMALSVLDTVLLGQLNERIFVTLIAGAFLVLSIVVGATTYRYVRARLRRPDFDYLQW